MIERARVRENDKRNEFEEILGGLVRWRWMFVIAVAVWLFEMRGVVHGNLADLAY